MLHQSPLKKVLLTTLLNLLALLPTTLAECTRSSLLTTAQSCITPQSVGSLSGLKLFPTNFTYMENNKAASISHSILTTPFKIDLSSSTADTIARANYTLLISSSGF